MSQNGKRRFGDRRDGKWVRDVPSMQALMPYLMPKRTDAEVCLRDMVDVTEIMKYLEKKNAEHPEYKTTLFHCLLITLARMLYERPLMNRFVQGRRTYQRNDIIISFTAKRRFSDKAEESLMSFTFDGEDDLDKISRRVVGDVNDMRTKENTGNDFDAVMKGLAKIPRFIMLPLCGLLRILDFYGKVPRAIADGDESFSSILCSNLGSIKCPSIYHHLNNYGTTSIAVILGTIHKEEVLTENGTKDIRDVVDVTATLDERIGDGFYFARSLKLVKYVFAHPELLDKPLSEPSGFDYK